MEKNKSEKEAAKAKFILGTGIVIAAGRIAFNTLGEEAILVFMAIVNVVAFGFVLFILYEGIAEKCTFYIENAGILSENKKEIKTCILWFRNIWMVLYLVFGYIYVSLYGNAGINDVLSVLALVISIANDGLVDSSGKWIYKRLVWFAKLRKKYRKK